MADRFPSIEDLDAGMLAPVIAMPASLTFVVGDSEIQAQPTGGNFLEREREMLGEDADFFSTNDTPAQTQGASVEDGDDDDLLGSGGDDFSAPQPSGAQDDNDMDGFKSAFPAIDTRNDVRSTPPTNQSRWYSALTSHRTLDQAVPSRPPAPATPPTTPPQQKPSPNPSARGVRSGTQTSPAATKLRRRKRKRPSPQHRKTLTASTSLTTEKSIARKHRLGRRQRSS